MELDKKCKCGHKKDVHMNKGWQDNYDGECCIIYRKDGEIKSCPCTEFR